MGVHIGASVAHLESDDGYTLGSVGCTVNGIKYTLRLLLSCDAKISLSLKPTKYIGAE